MWRMRWIVPLVCGGCLAGCGASSAVSSVDGAAASGVEDQSRSDDDGADWLGAPQEAPPDVRGLVPGSHPAPGVRPSKVQTLGEGASAPLRPPRVGGRNVRFHRAPLDQALGFLADAGGFSLVIQGEIDGQVSMDLFDVEPYDALLVLADAHQMSARYRQGVVILSALGAASADESRAEPSRAAGKPD